MSEGEYSLLRAACSLVASAIWMDPSARGALGAASGVQRCRTGCGVAELGVGRLEWRGEVSTTACLWILSLVGHLLRMETFVLLKVDRAGHKQSCARPLKGQFDCGRVSQRPSLPRL